MLKASIIFFSLGILLILSTFINFKRSKKVNYTKPKLDKFIRNFKNGKFLSFLISEEDSSNRKLLKQIQVISQCSNSETINKNKYRTLIKNDNQEENKAKSPQDMLKNMYLSQIGIFISVLAIGLLVKYSLNNMIVEETLSSINIHNITRYQISTTEADYVLDFVGDDYKHYIKSKNIDGLKAYIYEYAKANKLNIDQDDIYKLCDIYIQAYEEETMDIKEIGMIALLALISTLLVKLYINVRYKICNVKLLSEFYSMELLALLHMNRDELNVYEILTELNKYSVYLKPYLTRCLNRYSSDPIVALEKLMKEVNNESFSSFILILKSCLDKSKNINSEVLKLQRKLRFLNEKLDNDKSLEYKQLWLTIAQFPLIIMFALNILIPFLTQINIGIAI